MTYKHSTENLGEDLLTWYLEDSRAKTLVPLEKAQESKESDHPCGNTWRESSVKFDLNTLSWKTHLCLWEEDLEPSSLTLPKWGMMRGGVLWERITLPHHIKETEYGCWLGTPTASMSKRSEEFAEGRLPTPAEYAAQWPTPTCADATMGAILNDNTKLITLKSGKLRKISNQGVSGSIGLARTVAIYPTPRCHDAKKMCISEMNRKSPCLAATVIYTTPTAHNAKETNAPSESNRNTPTLAAQVGGHLNPTWVEKLMGWPQNWTEVKPMIDFQFISWIMGFCECENTRTKEIMRVLQNSNGAQNFQRKAGRPISIQEAEILLSLMFQHEIGSDEAWLLMEGAEAPQGEVRGVRIQAGIASSPHRPGHQKQPAGEYPDAMQALPRLLAYDGKAAWKDQSWENALPRVATGVAARVDRLRCIGNGQVPAVAALAWRILSQSSTARL